MKRAALLPSKEGWKFCPLGWPHLCITLVEIYSDRVKMQTAIQLFSTTHHKIARKFKYVDLSFGQIPMYIPGTYKTTEKIWFLGKHQVLFNCLYHGWLEEANAWINNLKERNHVIDAMKGKPLHGFDWQSSFPNVMPILLASNFDGFGDILQGIKIMFDIFNHKEVTPRNLQMIELSHEAKESIKEKVNNTLSTADEETIVKIIGDWLEITQFKKQRTEAFSFFIGVIVGTKRYNFEDQQKDTNQSLFSYKALFDAVPLTFLLTSGLSIKQIQNIITKPFPAKDLGAPWNEKIEDINFNVHMTPLTLLNVCSWIDYYRSDKIKDPSKIVELIDKIWSPVGKIKQVLLEIMATAKNIAQAWEFDQEGIEWLKFVEGCFKNRKWAVNT